LSLEGPRRSHVVVHRYYSSSGFQPGNAAFRTREVQICIDRVPALPIITRAGARRLRIPQRPGPLHGPETGGAIFNVLAYKGDMCKANEELKLLELESAAIEELPFTGKSAAATPQSGELGEVNLICALT
jgi:hypothetical protein